ncbi:MAG: biotin transporter BioY [Candidatus Omnitrophica bacterium]|nr:biotin transporter BioY [Candidatus Omnitrophota bacterium]
MEAILKKEIIINKDLCKVIAVAVFVILTALGAFVRIPLFFTPVPITLQTLFVLLSGAFLGSRLGGFSQICYAVLGIAGIPLFTGSGSGLLYLSGPTSGYIFGFIFAAIFLGTFLKYFKSDFSTTFLLFCVADILILVCGSLWIKQLFRCSLLNALTLGFIPFIVGDILKALVATIIYSKLNSRFKEIF